MKDEEGKYGWVEVSSKDGHILTPETARRQRLCNVSMQWFGLEGSDRGRV